MNTLRTILILVSCIFTTLFFTSTKGVYFEHVMQLLISFITGFWAVYDANQEDIKVQKVK